jgi:hypothetical protein
MQGERPTDQQTDALARWVDGLPELKLSAADGDAVQRG